MTALWLAALAALPPLPDHAAERYRMEIGGAAVGVATLSLRCHRDACAVVFETTTRLPEAGGGGVQERRVEVETDRAGTALSARGAGAPRALGGDRVASLLAEMLLAPTPEGERRCLEVEDVESRRSGRACATRRGAWLEGEILGEPVRFRPGARGFPAEVVLPAQGARFVADAGAKVPARAPEAFGVEVPAPPGAHLADGLSFCGLPPEPQDPTPPPPGIPREFPGLGHCREDAAAYLREARGEGLSGRHVVGVAWDGRRFVWHEWVELAIAGGWVPVDPSFQQIPAQAPRFAVARFTDGDEGGRSEAGRRVLRCWGKARVQVGARSAPAPRP